jgi:glycine cleavage system H protein
MSKVPADLRYTKEHEWAKREGDLIVVGITDHAQSQLGDVVFLELPEKGRTLKSGDTFGVVESVKAVSDLYAPLAGEVAEANAAIVNTPEGVNSDPYGAAWLIKVRPSKSTDYDALLDAKAYEALIAK